MSKTRKPSTWRSLVLSALSFFLCVVLLVGATFAWFTMQTDSARNIITAGMLKVELLRNGNQSVNGDTKLFKLPSEPGYWEPGVMTYENLTVKNTGDMALKYQLSLNIYDYNYIDGTNPQRSLLDVIKVCVVAGGLNPAEGSTTVTRADAQAAIADDENEIFSLSDWVTTGNLKKTDDPDTYGIILYWEPTAADSDYNVATAGDPNIGERLFVELGARLVATQLVSEADVFDNTYDSTATLPVLSKPMTKPLADTESLEIIVPVEAQSSVKGASVPADVANAIFNTVFEGSEATDKSLTLVLNVEKKGEKQTESGTTISTEINYAIDMDAVIKEITAGEVTKNITKSVNDLDISFDDFVEVQMTIDSGLYNVVVKHNGNPMTAVADKEAIASAEDDPDGYFNYAQESGLTKLWTKTFSPFTVEGKVNMTYTRDDALNKCRHTHTKTIGTKTDGKYYCTDENGDDICDLCNGSMIVEVTSIDDFAYTNSWYRANPGNTKYKLMEDITCDNCIFFSSGTTLDMNGHTFTHNGSYWSTYSNVAKTVLNITDSSTGEQKGKLICKNYLFDLSNNELDVNVSGGVIIDATQFASSIFRISNNTNKPVVKVTGADMAVGQLLLAQGSCDITFKDCKVTSTEDGIVQVIPQSKSNDMDIKFENCELKSTATSYGNGVISMLNNNGSNNTCTVTVKDSTVSIGGGYAICTRNQLVLDHATIKGGTIQTYSGSSVTYKNDTTVNGVVQPNTAE